MTAVAGRDQDRRRETGDDAEHRERERILQHREHAGARDEHEHQCERGRRPAAEL